MFKRLLSMALALVLVAAVAVVPMQETASAATNSQSELLNSNPVYKAVGYKSHDCVLTANVYMLRRAGILKGSTTWDEITNTVLRPYACTSRTSSSLKFSYTYSKDGIKYNVVHAYLSGSVEQKTAKLRELLKKHPEGIVVRGRAKAGFGHGVLITGYENGTFYAADSTQNINGANKGIMKYSATTMAGISTLKNIWYIESQSGESVSAVKTSKVTGLSDQKITDGKIKLSWKYDGAKLDGYAVYKADSKSGTYNLVGTTDSKTYTIRDKQNGKTYYYKVKGYKVISGKKIYTEADIEAVVMSIVQVPVEEVNEPEIGEAEEPESTIREDEDAVDKNDESTGAGSGADDESDLD